MEWYFGSDIEDLAASTIHEEFFERFPSPDDWSARGKIGNFNSPKKCNVFGIEEFLFSEDTFSDEACTPSVSQCSRRAYPHEHSDFQLNDLSIIDEADDIFLSSLFEADASAVGVNKSAKFTQTSSKDDVMLDVDHLAERNYIEDCMNNGENIHPSPPANGVEHDTSVSQEQSDACDDMIDEDISVEESVLMELQSTTLQLANKTRICFRDSLYRLAQNSRDQATCSQNGKEDLEQCKPSISSVQSRLQESKKANKSETNAIDITVANLLFNITREMPYGEYEGNFHFYQPIPGGDAEVPEVATVKRSYSLLN